MPQVHHIYNKGQTGWFTETDKLLKPDDEFKYADEPTTVQPTGVRTANGERGSFETIE